MATEPAVTEFERVAELMESGAIFVFGSNRAGVHGAGAAKEAAKLWGARRGVGFGRSGRSYAIPTKATWDSGPLQLAQIADFVERFLLYAEHSSHLTFAVTRIGCGLAGYTDADIAPLFATAPRNCELPDGWRSLPSGGER